MLSIAQGGTTTKFLYDGPRLIAEYDGSNALLRRYVHGDGVDDPIVWYDSNGTTNKRNLFKDERGSVVAADTGSAVQTKRYDEYGNTDGTYAGRFQYTGQTWLSEIGLNYYKARLYNPDLGRFMQADPIGYGDGMNMYAYVGNDPTNGMDPTGLGGCGSNPDCAVQTGGWGIGHDTGWIDFMFRIQPDLLPIGFDSVGDGGIGDVQGNAGEGGAVDDGEEDPNRDRVIVQAQFIPRPVPWGLQLFARPPVVVRPPPIPYPTNPQLPPGPGWVWKGGPEGSWVHPRHGVLRPDLNHPQPVGPHWDWKTQTGPSGTWYRWFPDGTLQLKSIAPGVVDSCSFEVCING